MTQRSKKSQSSRPSRQVSYLGSNEDGVRLARGRVHDFFLAQSGHERGHVPRLIVADSELTPVILTPSKYAFVGQGKAVV